MYPHIRFFDTNAHKLNRCARRYPCVGMNMSVSTSLAILYFVSFVSKTECESRLLKCCLGILEFVVAHVDG